MDSATLNNLVQTFVVGGRIVDLSHTLEQGIPCWPTQARFGHILYESYTLGDVACHYQLVMSEHTGTHIDAPLHFIQNGPTHIGIDEVPLSQVMGRAATIEATYVAKNALLHKQDIQAWEQHHGHVQRGDIVLIRYGFDKLWNLRPGDQDYSKDWPGLGIDAAEYLVDRGVKLVGCDTLAVDAHKAIDNPAHNTLLGNGVLIVENLTNLDQLPPFSFFMAFPLKVNQGSGSPIRAIALV